MSKICPNLIKTIHPQNQEAQQIPRSRKKTTLRHIIIKIIQNQLSEENQGVKNITFERNEQKMTAEPS